MTYKEKKDFLAGYIYAKNDIIGALSEIERWETIGTKVNQVLEYRPGSAISGDTKSKVEQAAVEVVTIINKIQKEIAEAERQKQAVLDVIEKHTKYRRQRNLLYWRFIRMMGYDEIAAVVGKDLRTVRRALRKAINDLDI